MPAETQAVLFKSKNWTPTKARVWLRKHKYKPIKRVDRTKNLLRYRLQPPKKYKRFITQKSKNNKSISFIVGFL